MADKLPSDFNPDGYAAAYPDVALSGLGAKEHYIRFGRLLGRSPNGKPPGGKAQASPSPDAAALPAVESAPPKAAIEHQTAAPVPTAPRRPRADETIVDRPDDFQPFEVVPSPAPTKVPRCSEAALGLDDFMPSERDGGSNAPLLAYARMVGIAAPAAAAEEPGAPRLCDSRFQSGELRLENGWFADPSTLRLMIAGGQQGILSHAGWALRAFQALPGSPAELRAAGPGIEIPKRGPCFVDMALQHPLMPLLLELTDPDGATRALALLPFPSLLPGGLHWAESKALQETANPIDSFWSLSDRFLHELIGGAESPARSIASIAVDASSREGPMLSDQVRDWLAVIFGVTEGTGGRAAGPKAAGLLLVLPPDAIPTIAALVSRRLAEGVGSSGPYLVAQADSRRPRWSVALPLEFEPPAAVPRLQGRGRAQRKAPASQAPVHLAILYRHPSSGAIAAADRPETSAMPPMTVLLDAADPARTEAVLQVLQDSAGATDFELWVRLDGGDEVRATLDRVRGAAHWRQLDLQAGLRDVARAARYDVLVTIDDRVRLAGDTLRHLAMLLDSSGDIASASCLLLGETITKNQVVLQPGSGGLFPSGVSFIGGPAMSFAEPDVSDALRDMTYPVVANTFALTVWRRGPLADLPSPVDRVARGAEDIGIGFDLTRAGFRNLCTTTCSAPITGDHTRRDAIDPLGNAVLQPGQWQDLLGRVTLVRELF